jgi:hypothetical protein
MIIGQIVDKIPAAHLRKAHPDLTDSETLLGVEVEVEGCSKSLPASKKETGYWLSKEDNSLREGGREFVFAEPLFGADVVAAIDFLTQEATEKKWKISERTGIHVHVDMRSVELEKFQNFCVLYSLVEPLLYNWIGDNRDRNIHCLPWYFADGDIDHIADIFANHKTAVTTIKNLNRYSGLNLNSLLSFGTAEFRQLKTTFSRKRIIDWINIILSIKQAALAWQGTPEQLIPEMRTLGAHGFATRVFKSLTPLLWYPEFSRNFIGLSIPVAEYLVKKSNPVPGIAREIIERHINMMADESGDHPGYLKFISRRNQEGAVVKPVKKKTPFDGSVLYGSVPEPIMWNTTVSTWNNGSQGSGG